MNDSEEQFVEYSELTESPPPESWIRQPQQSSGRPHGTPFQEQLMDAVVGSEFAKTTDGMRRRGPQLSFSYDQALEYLGMEHVDSDIDE